MTPAPRTPDTQHGDGDGGRTVCLSQQVAGPPDGSG